MHPPANRPLLPSTIAAVLCILCVAQAVAQAPSDFPKRPLRMVVPYPPGGSTDIVGRIVAAKLSESLGQQVVVDNRPGAGGNVGTDAVAKAPPDGHTLMLGSSSTLSFNPVVRADLPYKSGDFRPIYGLLRGAAIIAVAANSPFYSMADVLAEAKKRPGQLAMATYAPALQMAAAWLASMMGTTFTHVPYKGASQLLTDLVGGQVPIGLFDATAVAALIKAGKLRALGVASTERLPTLPNVPTLGESGFPDFVHFSWIALFVPAATPEAVAQRLENAVAEALTSPEYAALVEKSWGIPMRMGGQQLAEAVAADTARYQRLVRLAPLPPAR